MGGFADIPFDIGAKFGYLPDVALWGSLNYNSTIVGFDIHYALYARERGPVIAIGAGFDRLEGSVTGTVATVPSGTQRVASGMPAFIVWESSTIKAQAFVSQPLMASGFSLFGNIDFGYGANKAGVKFGDLKSPRHENMKDVSSLLFSGAAGLGCEIGAFRIDISFMWNFINFEAGLNFGIRYQR
jgi:hypothetical protein